MLLYAFLNPFEFDNFILINSNSVEREYTEGIGGNTCPEFVDRALERVTLEGIVHFRKAPMNILCLIDAIFNFEIFEWAGQANSGGSNQTEHTVSQIHRPKKPDSERALEK